jgi:transposase, IS30 family
MVNGRPGVAPQTAKRTEFTRLSGEGLSIAEAARRTGIHYRTGRRWLRGRTVRMPSGAARHYDPVIIVKAPVSARFLSEDERVTVADLRWRGHTIRAIGTRLGRAPSTISRELRRNQAPEGGYRPFRAQRMAAARRRRPGRGKIRGDAVLARFVQERLDRRWSPAQISTALRGEFPDQPARQLSTEAIYQAIYRSGSELRRPQRATLLRTGRRYRRRRLAPGHRPRRLVSMVSIDERPDIADRRMPGRWEGDLIVGTGNRLAIGTLVERTSRYTILLHLGGDGSAAAVSAAVVAAFAELPVHLRRSLTWDQGNEMACHAAITRTLGLPIYFCHPHAPWQRPTNENTNGLLRQYFPKGTDLSVHTASDLREVAAELNTRPRQVLRWATPHATFSTLRSVPVLRP